MRIRPPNTMWQLIVINVQSELINPMCFCFCRGEGEEIGPPQALEEGGSPPKMGGTGGVERKHPTGVYREISVHSGSKVQPLQPYTINLDTGFYSDVCMYHSLLWAFCDFVLYLGEKIMIEGWSLITVMEPSTEP